MDAYKQSSLWKTAFPENATDYPEQRQRIIQAYERFRERVSHLLGQIKCELPNLTLHDITHVDALWEVASQIAGPNYPLNPAEALVLGGAFLLHDAAHCRAAYPGGLDEIRKLNEWRDSAARRNLDPHTLSPGSNDYQAVLFDTLRVLHPKQAKALAFAKWKDKDNDEFLFPDSELRNAYGDLIGEIAESHWFHPHQLENFGDSPKTAPVCLSPANWTVDPLKIAIMLRTADACHLDAKRAPRFLMLLNQPNGISAVHWQFQSKIHQLKCDIEREELLITGSTFGPDEQAAWWQAYDAACLADRELNAADSLLRDFKIERLAAREVAGARTPERFAKHVPTKSWYPVDTSLRISNIQSVVERFGGEKLYGDKPWLALRELIQNARDAIHAARSLQYLNEDEGEIEIAIEDVDGGHWLHVTDNGIGMSRYVLTEVLLDFGHSLWRSTDLSGEWSGLASSGFEAVGQFGIGFFSVFMLGEKVRVCTRRCDPKEDENAQGWILEFDQGTLSRPLLHPPSNREQLKRPGTRISVFVTAHKYETMRPEWGPRWREGAPKRWTLAQVCAHLGPALDINLYLLENNSSRQQLVLANDWKHLSALNLLRRIAPDWFDNDDPDEFGLWSHLAPLHGDNGILTGRCAIGGFRNAGLGVVKGILAGKIENISGLIFCKSQPDLARQDALPAISFHALREWAEGQKRQLIALDALDSIDSKQLAHAGASYEGLILGTFRGTEVSFEELMEDVRNLELLLVHDGEVDFDADDEVLGRDFPDFRPSSYLLEITDDYSGAPRWIDQLPDAFATQESRTLFSALNVALVKAWGSVFWREGRVLVGSVQGTNIVRKCKIATPTPLTDAPIEDQDE